MRVADVTPRGCLARRGARGQRHPLPAAVFPTFRHTSEPREPLTALAHAMSAAAKTLAKTTQCGQSHHKDQAQRQRLAARQPNLKR